jgi:hypothetical protein
VDILGFKLEYIKTKAKFVFLSNGSSQPMIQQQMKSDHFTGKLQKLCGRGINFQIRTGN